MSFNFSIKASLGPSNGKEKNPVTAEEIAIGMKVIALVFSSANVKSVPDELLKDIPEDIVVSLEGVVEEDRVETVQGYCRSTIKKVLEVRGMQFRHTVTLNSICQKASVKTGLLNEKEAKEHFPSYYKSKKNG